MQAVRVAARPRELPLRQAREPARALGSPTPPQSCYSFACISRLRRENLPAGVRSPHPRAQAPAQARACGAHRRELTSACPRKKCHARPARCSASTSAPVHEWWRGHTARTARRGGTCGARRPAAAQAGARPRQRRRSCPSRFARGGGGCSALRMTRWTRGKGRGASGSRLGCADAPRWRTRRLCL